VQKPSLFIYAPFKTLVLHTIAENKVETGVEKQQQDFLWLIDSFCVKKFFFSFFPSSYF